MSHTRVGFSFLPEILRLVVLGAALVFSACHRPGSDPRADAADGGAGVVTYDVKGALQETSADGRKAVIAHEAIPGYMEAMTMEFDVREPKEMVGFQPGDVIAFQLSLTQTHGWIDHVRRVGFARAPNVRPTAAEPTMSPLLTGKPLSDCALIDQRGKRIRLSDFKGRALAFTFIFTRCPFPDFCPRMSNQFAAAQRELTESDAGANWSLLSLSFDPAYDTPERLSGYAAQFQPDAAHWTFATGSAEDILKLGGTFGLVVSQGGGQFNHNLRTVVVDAAGRVQKVFDGNDWTPHELAAEIKRAMAAKP